MVGVRSETATIEHFACEAVDIHVSAESPVRLAQELGVVDDPHGAAELRLHLLRPFLATGATRVAMHQDGTCSESPRRGSARQRGGEKAKAIHI